MQAFNIVPKNIFAYWFSKSAILNFKLKKIGNFLTLRDGMHTTENEKFIRFWYEVPFPKISFDSIDYINAFALGAKWYPYNKGGEYRKWYGNNEYVVDWENDGRHIKELIDEKTGEVKSHGYNGKYSFQEGITWSSIGSGAFSIRFSPKGYLFDAAGAKAFSSNHQLLIYCCALLNSKVADFYLTVLAPTVNYKIGDISSVPLKEDFKSEIFSICEENVDIVKKDWDGFETSWDFKRHPLV